MAVLALLISLVLDQFRPLHAQHRLYAILRSLAQRTRRLLDADTPQQARLLWALVVVLPAVASWLIFQLLYACAGSFLAFVWMVLVLHAALDFRAFSLHFTEVRNAFSTGDVQRARAALQRWMRNIQPAAAGQPCATAHMQAQVVRLSVLHMHRCVFGVFTAFLLLALLGLGPMGAVLYRLSGYAQRSWGEAPLQTIAPPASPDEQASPALAHVATTARYWIDWLPARVTMVMFAAVGRFDEALSTWRSCAAHGTDNDTLVLATATAAMGHDPHTLQAALQEERMASDDATFQEEASENAAALLHRLSTLIWRTLILWVLIMLVISLIGAS